MVARASECRVREGSTIINNEPYCGPSGPTLVVTTVVVLLALATAAVASEEDGAGQSPTSWQTWAVCEKDCPAGQPT